MTEEMVVMEIRWLKWGCHWQIQRRCIWALVGSIACDMVVTMAMVRWSNGDRRLAGDKIKWWLWIGLGLQNSGKEEKVTMLGLMWTDWILPHGKIRSDCVMVHGSSWVHLMDTINIYGLKAWISIFKTQNWHEDKLRLHEWKSRRES